MAGAWALLALAAIAHAAAGHAATERGGRASRAAIPVVASTYEVDDGVDETWAVRTHTAAYGRLSILRATYEDAPACSVALVRSAESGALLAAVVGTCAECRAACRVRAGGGGRSEPEA
jgi:hypothetical protein